MDMNNWMAQERVRLLQGADRDAQPPVTPEVAQVVWDYGHILSRLNEDPTVRPSYALELLKLAYKAQEMNREYPEEEV